MSSVNISQASGANDHEFYNAKNGDASTNFSDSMDWTVFLNSITSVSFVDCVLYVASSSNIIYFLLRAKLIHGCIKDGTPSDTYTSCFSYLVTLLNCILWLKFGIESQDITTIVVNGAGLALSLFSVVGYYYMAEHKSLARRQIILFTVLTYGYLFSLKIGLIPWQTLGPLASFVTVFMFSLPLLSYLNTLYRTAILKRASSFQNLKQIAMRRQAAASMLSPLTSITALVSSLAWAVYGKMMGDTFLCYANILAAVISLAQVFISLRRKMNYRDGSVIYHGIPPTSEENPLFLSPRI